MIDPFTLIGVYVNPQKISKNYLLSSYIKQTTFHTNIHIKCHGEKNPSPTLCISSRAVTFSIFKNSGNGKKVLFFIYAPCVCVCV